MVPKIYSKTVIVLFVVALIGSLTATARAVEQETSNAVHTEDGLSGPDSTSDTAGEDQETLVFAYEDESQFEALGFRPA